MKGLLFILAWLAITAPLHAQGPPPVRLALVSDSADAAKAADVLTAQLSGNPALQLLERDQIAKVYREQGLSAAKTDYVKLGHLLGADGLLLLETADDSAAQSLNIRLVAVKPGVVLVAEKFNRQDSRTTDWSAALAKHLQPFFPKLAVAGGDAIPLSLVNLRSAVATAEGRETERQLKLLAIQRLSREPQFFVLERQQLQLASDERELQGLDDSPFWSGRYLLDGVIDRDGYSPGTVTLSVRLIPPQGGAAQTIELQGDRNDLNSVINALAARLVEILRPGQHPVPWEASAEAGQFLDEARWAARWGLPAETLAAGESAWALGLHTSELGALRIEAYADDVWPDSKWIGGNIRAPEIPDAAKLPHLSRALDLFGRDTQLLFANEAPWDARWHDAGLRIFYVAAGMLSGFYHTAELRAGHEDELAELRSLARQTMGLLDARDPVGRNSWSPFGSPQFVPNNSRFHEDWTMYGEVRWEEGGCLFDRPEDSLGLFRQMAEAGCLPTELPGIIGWTPEDRRRVPQIRNRLVEELVSNTNPAARLTGYILALVKTPYYPEADFQAREQDLVAGLWTYRDWVLDGANHTVIVKKTEDILNQKYSGMNAATARGLQPFHKTKEKLFQEFLSRPSQRDEQSVFETLKPDFSLMTSNETRALIPLLEKRGIKIYSPRVRQLIGLPPAPAEMPVARRAATVEETLTASFIGWTLDHCQGEGLHPQLEDLLYRNAILWGRVCCLASGQFFPVKSPTEYAGVDPETGRCLEIPFPQFMGNPDPGFEVTADSLYVSVQDHLQRYHFKEQTWETIPVPMEAATQIIANERKLFLATPDSLLELDPDSHEVQIIASSRRQPPVSEIDTLLTSPPHQFFRAHGKLGLRAGNHLYLLAGAGGKWLPLTALNLDPPNPFERRDWFFSDEGAQLIQAGRGIQSRLLGISFATGTTEVLVQQPGHRERPDPMREQLLGPAHWDWPEPYDLESANLCGEGNALWFLQVRKIAYIAGPPNEPVAFQDDRQATVLRFQPESRQPMAVPVRFEKDGQPFDPFARTNLLNLVLKAPALNLPPPIWLSTPNGFVLACANLGGHWFLPKAELEKRLGRVESTLIKGANGDDPASVKTGMQTGGKP